MKHIAYITTEYPHLHLPAAGGIGSFIKLMATSLVKNNCLVTVFVCFSDKNKIWFDNDIRIIEIKTATASVLAPIKNRQAISKIINQYIKKDKIDLVEAPDWEGIHAFCNFTVPLITRIHGSVTYFNHLQKIKNSRFLFFLEKRAMKKAQKIIAVSNFSGELTKKVFSLKNITINTIYNGINPHIFEPTNNNTDKKNVLYFGTLARKKGVIALAHIFNKLHKINPNATLTLIGKDTIDYIEKKSTWKLIETILTPHALKKVYYQGVIPYEKMVSKIADSNVCVFPSFAEAFPISWLEAMAMQKPIVASSIGWAKEAIKNETSGLLEHPENDIAFAKKINLLLTDTLLAVKLAKNARNSVLKNFNQDTLIQQNINMYKKVINDK